MSTLKEKREKRAKAIADARAEFDLIDDNTSESDAAEIEARHDAFMGEADRLEKEIQRQETLEAAERSLDVTDERRSGLEDRTARDQRDEGDGQEPDYREVFTRAMRFGASALSQEEITVLARGRASVSSEERAQFEARAQSVGVEAAGGYTVPEGFSGELDRALADWGPMLDQDVARQYPTASGNPMPWPTNDDTAQTGEDKAENAAVTDDGSGDVTFGNKVLSSYLFDSKVVRVSIELLNDSAFQIEPLLAELFGERLGRRGNTKLTVGTGTDEPQGIVTGSSLGVTAASAGAVAPDELFDLQHSVNAAYRRSPKCRWMFSDDTLKSVRKFKDGDGNYLWQMGDIKAGEPDLLLNKPYSINDDMASIGATNKPIIFGDFSRYIVRPVGGKTVMALRERYAEYLQVGFLAYMRLDGRLLNSAAVKHLANPA